MSATLPEPRQLAGEFLDVALGAALDLSPRARVRLGGTVFASIVLARSRMPSLLAVVAAVGFGYAAERAYVVVHDVHQAAIEITAAAAEVAYPLTDDRPLLPDE